MIIYLVIKYLSMRYSKRNGCKNQALGKKRLKYVEETFSFGKEKKGGNMWEKLLKNILDASTYIYICKLKSMAYGCKKPQKYCNISVLKRSASFSINEHCIYMNISFSPFANKVECHKFPIESCNGHFFHFRILRHS